MKTSNKAPILTPVRLFFGVIGGALAFYGWQHKRNVLGRVATSVGVGLITKSLDNSIFSGPTDVLTALMAQLRTSFPKLLITSNSAEV